jgi:hypothetical protein
VNNSTLKTKTCKRCGDAAFRGDLCLPCSIGQAVSDYARTEHGKSQLAQFEQERKEKTRLYNETRKNRIDSLPSDFTQDDRSFAFEYFSGRCAVCEKPLQDLFGETSPSTDHWVPVCDPRPDNPGTVPTNIIPLCHGAGGCNNKKGSRDPVEWLNDEFGARKAKEILERIETFFDSLK